MNNTENKEYRIARLDAGKLKDLENLYQAVYGHKPVKDYFLKKYNTAYTGAEYIGYIGYNLQDIPIAFYGVMPCLIEYNHEIILSAQSGDTMTDPRFRYKGLFVELSKITFELCKATGIKFIFGFPNQNSYHGAVHKLGWKMTETIDSFTISVNTFPLESLSQRFGWTKRIYQLYTKWVLRKYSLKQDGVLNSVIAEGYGGVYRNDRYLQYKAYNEREVIMIGNAKIWIKIKGGLIIGDLEISDYDFDRLILVVKKIARRLGTLQVSFQVSPGTNLHRLFAASHNSLPTFPVLFQDFGTTIPFDKLKFTFADIDIF